MYHSCLIHTLLIVIVSCSTSTSHHHQLISPPSDLRYPQSCHLILLKQPVILHGILQQVRGRASQPRLPASRFFTTGRSCRWSPTKTWLLWLGEIWQISLSNFGRSSSWFKTHIPKTKVITLNTSTFFFGKRHLFVLSSSALPILPLRKTLIQRDVTFFCAESVNGCVSKLDGAPQNLLDPSGLCLWNPCKYHEIPMDIGEPLLLRHTHPYFASLHLRHCG